MTEGLTAREIMTTDLITVTPTTLGGELWGAGLDVEVFATAGRLEAVEDLGTGIYTTRLSLCLNFAVKAVIERLGESFVVFHPVVLLCRDAQQPTAGVGPGEVASTRY